MRDLNILLKRSLLNCSLNAKLYLLFRLFGDKESFLSLCQEKICSATKTSGGKFWLAVSLLLQSGPKVELIILDSL